MVPIEELNPDSNEDEAMWAIAEDQAQVLEGRDAEELGIAGEAFVDGEDITDVLRRHWGQRGSYPAGKLRVF